MSYCRWGPDSDVYVFLHVGGFLTCCACCRYSTFKSFDADNTSDMVDHLVMHKTAGDQVPEYVIPELLQDDHENFPNED